MTASQPAGPPAVVSPRRREQWRAHYAMQAIATVPPAQKSDYERRAQGLPAMIQNLGLAGALAFLLSKDAPDQRLARDLSDWLLRPEAGVDWSAAARSAGGQGVWIAIGHQTTTALTYRRAAAEAKHYANWLKRWSRADAAGTQAAATEPRQDAANAIH